MIPFGYPPPRNPSPKCSYAIRWHWDDRQESTAAIADKIVRTLTALSNACPLLTGWGIADPDWKIVDPDEMDEDELENMEDSVPLPFEDVAGRMEEIVEGHVDRDDWGKACPRAGYHILVFKNAPPGHPRDQGIVLKFGVGSVGSNTIHFDVGGVAEPSSLEISTLALFKPVFDIVTAIWSPLWASASVFRMYYYEPNAVAGVSDFPYSAVHMPWMVYLSAPLMEGIIIPSGLQPELTPDGGLQFTSTQEQLNPDNPAHMQVAKTLAELVIPRLPANS